MEKRIKKWQLRIFIACFLAYTAAYICRLNISVAIPGLQDDLKFSSASVGLIGSAFFWVYAVGQLVNGYIGDKVSSRLFIFTGLVISAIINILFGFSSILIIMVVLWGVNGIFQSMLWGPIVKTLSKWFKGNKFNLVAFGMSISLIIGSLIAWGFSGIILKYFSWRWTFRIPAMLVLTIAVIWFVMARNTPEEAGIPQDFVEDTHKTGSADDNTELSNDILVSNQSMEITLGRLLFKTNLPFVAIAGMAQGLIDKSIQLWLPKLLMDTLNLSIEKSIGATLIIPVVNFAGILFAGWLNRMLKAHAKLSVVWLMTGSAIASLGLVLFSGTSSLLNLLLIICTSALINGANPLMTSIIPMSFKSYNKVSTVAGFIDFSIYVGAGLGGVLTEFIVDKFGWYNAFIMWTLILAAGTFSMFICNLNEKKQTSIMV